MWASHAINVPDDVIYEPFHPLFHQHVRTFHSGCTLQLVSQRPELNLKDLTLTTDIKGNSIPSAAEEIIRRPLLHHHQTLGWRQSDRKFNENLIVLIAQPLMKMAARLMGQPLTPKRPDPSTLRPD
jgi:hypothetical protein